jgi:hypothetical protein
MVFKYDFQIWFLNKILILNFSLNLKNKQLIKFSNFKQWFHIFEKNYQIFYKFFFELNKKHKIPVYRPSADLGLILQQN